MAKRNDNNIPTSATAILCITIALILFAAWLTAPTKAEIETCAQKTGWSTERCEHEINR